MTNALDDLIKDDDAAWIEISFDDRLVVGVATVNKDGDEIAFYEEGDLPDAVRDAAQQIVPSPNGGAARYEKP